MTRVKRTKKEVIKKGKGTRSTKKPPKRNRNVTRGGGKKERERNFLGGGNLDFWRKVERGKSPKFESNAKGGNVKTLYEGGRKPAEAVMN